MDAKVDRMRTEMPVQDDKISVRPEEQDEVVLLETKALGKKIWTVGGGKGGTGKSVITANLGLGLAVMGHKVILVDGDLGGSDLHLFLNVPLPRRNLSDFLGKEFDALDEVLIPTPNENLKIICGGGELLGMANLPYQRKEKLKRHIANLDADIVMVDLGAGTSYNTLDLFALSSEGIVVCTPDPMARIDAYAFVKNSTYRRLLRAFSNNERVKRAIVHFGANPGRKSAKIVDLLRLIRAVDRDCGKMAAKLLADFHPKLILNKVRKKSQLNEVDRFLSLVWEYLSVRMEYIGYIENDGRVVEACERTRPFLIEYPRARAAENIYSILFKLGVKDRTLRFTKERPKKMSKGLKAESKYWRD